MRVLIILGAGASLDCWPGNDKITDYERLPLANKLFASLRTQNLYLNRYELMGLASKLRRQLRVEGDNFDVEKELDEIATRAAKNKDLNNEQGLFKTRFYLHGVIRDLTQTTLDNTSSHTTYVDMMAQLKEWVDDAPSDRNVDIVTFNYDDLIERSMNNVYSHDWYVKSSDPLSAYYEGTNLRIYKPHGSINWGRIVVGKENKFKYIEARDAFIRFNQIDLLDEFSYVEPDVFTNSTLKNYIPAIAVPMKNKVDFKECPKNMYDKMVEALENADVAITIGWKGGDNHFVQLLKKHNKKIKTFHIVGPSGGTNLTETYTSNFFDYHKFGFSQFVSNSVRFEELLDAIK